MNRFELCPQFFIFIFQPDNFIFKVFSLLLFFVEGDFCFFKLSFKFLVLLFLSIKLVSPLSYYTVTLFFEFCNFKKLLINFIVFFVISLLPILLSVLVLIFKICKFFTKVSFGLLKLGFESQFHWGILLFKLFFFFFPTLLVLNHG